MTSSARLDLLALQADLKTQLAGSREVRKAVTYGLRATRSFFDVPYAAIATLADAKDEEQVDLLFSLPHEHPWDLGLLGQFLRNAKPHIPEDTLFAPIYRRGRRWAVLALRKPESRLGAADGATLSSVARTLGGIIGAIDEERTRRVLRKIVQKIASRLEPKDLIYQILHGLRSLTDYDHSAALYMGRKGESDLELVAEQIAWTKAKSLRIGQRLPFGEEIRHQLEDGGVHLFERTEAGWSRGDGKTHADLPRLLDCGSAAQGELRSPPEQEMICAPFPPSEGTVGVLKVSALRRGVLGGYEAALVEEFMPLAALAFHFSVRTESLQARIVRSERKHAIANLTRGIAHDVNNALGSMLPLVQQLREEAASGRVDRERTVEDLRQIETSVQTCRRIFSGMLSSSRGARAGLGEGNLRRAIESALSVVADSLKRLSIDVSLDLPAELPAIRGTQSDLTQLFLNLLGNARDAMPEGGELGVTAVRREDRIHASVRDTGVGIRPDRLERVLEPFYTTREEGEGLGLSICRSVMWEIGGNLEIESEPGAGTTVHLTFPLREQHAGEKSR
jgi:signal transduction histidine kinase